MRAVWLSFGLGKGVLVGGFGAARRRGSVTDPYFSICLYRRTWFAFYGWRGEKERHPFGPFILAPPSLDIPRQKGLLF